MGIMDTDSGGPWWAKWGPWVGIVIVLLGVLIGLIPSPLNDIPRMADALENHRIETSKIVLFMYRDCLRGSRNLQDQAGCDSIMNDRQWRAVLGVGH